MTLLWVILVLGLELKLYLVLFLVLDLGLGLGLVRCACAGRKPCWFLSAGDGRKENENRELFSYFCSTRKRTL